MSLLKAKRKIKRIGKTAVQFRVSSTFEFIELDCKGTWRPEKLRVVWYRSHRKVKSNDTTMVVSEDFGPNGAKGKAVFNPAIAVSLLVTLYRDANHTDFEEKEYKYHIESEGESGKKILATFNCNVAEFVGIPSTKQALDLNFKCVSKKVRSVKLGITLECNFMKEGKAMDDDMQSTFSAVSAGVESVAYDEEEEEEEGVDLGREVVELSSVASTSSDTSGGNRDRLNTLQEETEPESSMERSHSLVLGTGEHLKRGFVPLSAPPKPARTSSFKAKNDEDLPPLDATPTTVDASKSYVENPKPENPKSDLPVPNGVVPDIVVVSTTLAAGSKSVDVAKSGAQDTVEPLTGNKETEGPFQGGEPQMIATPAPPPAKPNEQQVADKKANQEAALTGVADSASQHSSEKLSSSASPPIVLTTPPAESGGDQQTKPAAASESISTTTKKKEGKSAQEKKTESKAEGKVTAVETGKDQDSKQVENSTIKAEDKGTNLLAHKKKAERAEVAVLAEAASTSSLANQETQTLTAAKEKESTKVVNTGTQTPSQERKAEVRNQEIQTTEIKKPQATHQETLSGREEAQDRENKTVTVNQGVQTAERPQTVSQGMQAVAATANEGIQTEAEVKPSPPPPADDEEPKSKPTTQLIKETVLDAENSNPPTTAVLDTAATSPTRSSSSANSLPRKVVESKETYEPPPNPYLVADSEEGVVVDEVASRRKSSPTDKWIDSSVVFVDCFEDVVGREKLDSVDIVGLYFSAGWCPPCRRFLPKLVKFYHHLKQQGKSFELIYISSDYSKQDMIKYMKEQQMPWLAVDYDGDASDNFRKTFKVSAVPLLKILATRGHVVEESAKKSIEGASNGSAIVKLYNKWHEKVEEGRTTKGSRKSLLSKIIKSKDDSDELAASSGPQASESLERMSVSSHQRAKDSKVSKVTREMLGERDEKIQHLEEVNKTLKMANDEMREEVANLKAQLVTMTRECEELKVNSDKLQDESKQMVNNLNMRGWLYKRGVKGPTANVWRRRYFRLDEGSKLYYYKNSTEGTPQGFIDLDKVLSVQEISSAQQDKNHATFSVQCDGRTFQLQAHDEPGMRRWIEAISYITEWRRRNSTSVNKKGARP